MEWTQESMASAAVGYEYALCDPQDTQSSFNPHNGKWEHHPDFDPQELGKMYFDTPKIALAWLQTEIKAHMDDGLTSRAKDFESMLSDGVNDPVIIGNSEQDGMELWDGVHRLAAAYAKGRKCPALIGTRVR